MKKISRYFKGVGEEVRRIRWPSRHLLWTSVLVVCCVTILFALSLLFCDFIAAEILKAFENAFNNGDSNKTSATAAALLIENIGGLL